MRAHRTVAPWFVFGSIVALAAGPALAARATVTTRQEVKVTHIALVVDSDGGNVDVKAGQAGLVMVEAERHAATDEAARSLPVEVKLDGGTLHVRFRRGPTERQQNESVDFHITLPADSPIAASTGGGAVSIRGATGGLDVKTGGGSIRVEGARGNIQASTGGGAIEMTGISGTVDVNTGGGGIHVAASALSGRNRMSTGGGGITVAIPKDSKLSVDASTGGGGAHNDFGLPTEGDKWGPPRGFHGKIGDGSGGTLEMNTGGGGISLEQSKGE